MSVSEMQACMARLYVDDSFRKLFFLDPDDTVQGYQLTPDESSALKNVDRKMLDFFSRSLKNKRKDRIQPVYPALFSIAKTAIGRYYHRYYQLHIRSAHEPDHQDILHFGLFMEESMAGAEDVPAYATEVARYERLCYWTHFCQATEAAASVCAPAPAAARRLEDRLERQQGIRIESFSYDVFAVEENVQSGTEIDSGMEIQRGDYYVLFRPARASYESKVLRINSATKTLLDLCDGSRTISEIIAAVEQHFGATDLQQALLTALDRLLSIGAVQILGR